MSLSTDNAGSAFRSFSASDLGTLEALQSHPRPAGWTFHRDRDESWDLIAIQPPSYHRRDHDPLWRSPAFLVIPAPIGEVGVLLTLPNGTDRWVSGGVWRGSRAAWGLRGGGQVGRRHRVLTDRWKDIAGYPILEGSGDRGVGAH